MMIDVISCLYLFISEQAFLTLEFMEWMCYL
jgi:hypothetical protein